MKTGKSLGEVAVVSSKRGEFSEKTTLYLNIANKSLEIYAGVIILNAIVM